MNTLQSFEDLLAEQKRWMQINGGSLTGYIARYGDPGNPPLNVDGNPMMVELPPDVELRSRFVPVPGYEHTFYANMVGDGGTKIYEADSARLKYYEERVEELRRRCWRQGYLSGLF